MQAVSDHKRNPNQEKHVTRTVTLGHDGSAVPGTSPAGSGCQTSKSLRLVTPASKQLAASAQSVASCSRRRGSASGGWRCEAEYELLLNEVRAIARENAVFDVCKILPSDQGTV